MKAKQTENKTNQKQQRYTKHICIPCRTININNASHETKRNVSMWDTKKQTRHQDIHDTQCTYAKIRQRHLKDNKKKKLNTRG